MRDCSRAHCHRPRAASFRTRRCESSHEFRSRRCAGCVSPATQLALGFGLTELLPWNHYARKMVGYLWAAREGAGVIGQLAFVDQHKLGDQYLASYVKKVMAVTPEDVRRVANQYFVPDKMTLVIVGDTKTVQDQVAAWSKR